MTPNLNARLNNAVEHFWNTRGGQAKKQGSRTGQRDQGSRAAVTGGAQLDGFVELLRSVLVENGLPEPSIYDKRRIDLPGYFRPEKKWDLLVVLQGKLIAGIEFKSHCGPSFGNNFNNRTEEALGNSTDLLAAYRQGAFKPSNRPWLGYLMLLEETEKSTKPLTVRESHFKVLPEFRGTSYAKRYEILLTKLVRERLYDSTCLILTKRDKTFREPSDELCIRNFLESLLARAIAATRMQ